MAGGRSGGCGGGGQRGQRAGRGLVMKASATGRKSDFPQIQQEAIRTLRAGGRPDLIGVLTVSLGLAWERPRRRVRPEAGRAGCVTASVGPPCSCRQVNGLHLYILECVLRHLFFHRFFPFPKFNYLLNPLILCVF